MKKRRSILLLAMLYIGLNLLPLHAQLIVKQNKEGRVSITNHNAAFTSSKNRSGSKNSVSSVPAYIYSRILHYSKKYGVKKELILAVARAESSYNQFAKSHKGAVGIMQLMPDTARQYGVVNRYNVDQNIEAGIKHLRYLYRKYNNDIVLALAAYNAGENAVAKYNGVPPYRETKGYIRKIFRFMNKPISLGNHKLSAKSNTVLYRYKTKDGRIVITDRFPSKIKKGKISIIGKL